MAKRRHDPDAAKGAVEQDRRSQPTNTSLRGQLPHRNQNPVIKGRDTDFPEPGGNPEHSGEPRGKGSPETDRARKPKRRVNHEPRVAGKLTASWVAHPSRFC